MSSLKILRTAPSMSFQDLGRFGYTHLGLSQGGPLDLHAHCWANRLLGNHSNATTIEISYGNASFKATSPCRIAITGAEMQATIDGNPIANWSTHYLQTGQTLQLRYARKGVHTYLAIQHGFTSPQHLGSSATVTRNDIGTPLQENTTISAIALCESNNFTNKITPPQFIPDYDAIDVIHLIFPPTQDAHLNTLLQDTAFTISPQSNRMGTRLLADTSLPKLQGILSEGIALGTIQLPPNGHPIALLNDRQTQGGYAKIGTIARCDVSLFVQARPGTRIRFRPISLAEAAEKWARFARFFRC